MSSRAIELFGIPINAIDLQEAISAISRLRSGYVVTVNAETYRYFEANASFRKAVLEASLRLCDAVSVQAGIRLVCGSRIPRVPGADLVTALLAVSPGPYFLLGSTKETVRRAARRVRDFFPGARICGHLDGYGIRDASGRARAVSEISGASPRFVLVGLGIPLQELWMYEHRATFSQSVLIGVGGTLDVLAGVSRRAPSWMRSAGLEWAWRIGSEPARLPRFLRSHFPFLAQIASASLSGPRTEQHGNPA
ncbi:MAG: WecB/TagA/CpsF family glycosyltransferase [bacterium JZ-2024 1]